MLVVGADGFNVLNAVVHGAAHVDVLETNPDILDLMTGHLREFNGDLYDRNDVTAILEEARAFSRRTSNRYDLIILPVSSSPSASATGASAQDTNYLMTKQAIADFLAILSRDGAVIMGCRLDAPPRGDMKAFSMAVAALRKQGTGNPGDHLFFARSLNTILVMTFREPINSDRVATVKEFCERNGFDRIYHPGIDASEVNRFNVMKGDSHFTMAREIVNGRGDWVYGRHIYNIRPATDDRPYFSHFFRWAALPQLLRQPDRNLAVQIGWGYMFLLITLVQAVPLGILLILVPLLLSRKAVNVSRSFRWQAYAYFAAIGLGYMFLEMAIIQQYARFLRHPIHAFALVLALMLICSGLGSLVSSHRRMTPRLVFTWITILALTHIFFWQMSIHYGAPALFLVDLLVVAAMAFFMGSPFPQGIAALKTHAPGLIAWVWGINGFISVVAVLLAGLLSISLGLTAIFSIGALSYLAAAVVWTGMMNQNEDDGILRPTTPGIC